MTPLMSRLTLGADEWLGIFVILVGYMLFRRWLRHRPRLLMSLDLGVLLTFAGCWAYAVYVRGYPRHEAIEDRFLVKTLGDCR